MDLLAYTKNLYKKICFYDKVLKNKNFDKNMTNPFVKPLNVTIIWVENDDDC